ncbi:hypothetical protein N500_0312 [Wolbachia pipientis wUni]|nr:hypothetical protein N500_0312 [Wolbachia pipientis wUni]
MLYSLWLLTLIFCGIFFLSRLNGYFIMNFVSSHQIFQLLCNKAIPVSATRMTKKGALG